MARIPHIRSDIDILYKEVERNLRLVSMESQILNSIEDYLTRIRDDEAEMYNYELHRHHYHKHDTEKGHSYYDGCVTKGNAGTSYLHNNRGHRTLYDLLMQEYREAVDWDTNGMVYFHDFCFAYDDPDLPVGLKKSMSSFIMPGFPKYHRLDDDYIPENMEAALWPDEYEVIQIDFEDDHSTPKFVKRNKPVKIISWKDYLRSLPDEFYRQRSELLALRHRNIK